MFLRTYIDYSGCTNEFIVLIKPVVSDKHRYPPHSNEREECSSTFSIYNNVTHTCFHTLAIELLLSVGPDAPSLFVFYIMMNRKSLVSSLSGL